MKIYGVALLAGCFLLGKFTGYALGMLINIDGDMGGVGFAMIYLILTNAFMEKKGLHKKKTKNGVLFWGSMYIPIVIAMAATQNVKVAWDGGWIAIVVSVAVVFLGYLLVPLISKIGKKTNKVEL
tara:strand:- start:2197 stop:2571 length:375 start_codon:yes stop_codon:yes gene_type:complete